MKFLLFICLSFPLFADPLQQAGELERKSDPRGAAALYQEWLSRNISSPDFLKILLHAADIHPDPRKALEILDQFQKSPLSGETLGEILAKKAAILEMLGDFGGAQKSLEQAYRGNPSEASLRYLLRSAVLLFETGEARRSEEQTRDVAGRSTDPMIKKRAVFHLARILAADGKHEESLRIASLLTTDAANRDGNEGIFLFIIDLAGRLKRENEKKAAYDKLAAEYPDSPEFRLAKQNEGKSASVKPFPSPSSLLNPAFPPKSEEAIPPVSAAAKQKDDKQTPPSAVQTGSFSMKENAEYMVRDLKKLGFPAEFREDPRPDGRKMFKVVVPLAAGQRTVEETQKVLIRLKEQGIEGFLLFDDSPLTPPTR